MAPGDHAPALVVHRVATASRDAGDALAATRALLADAEQADGTPPVSDQALLAASQGRRALLAFGSGAGAAAGAEGAADAAAPDPLAIGILGEGELDLVVRPAARGRGVGRAALTTLLDVAAREQPGELRAWAHGENPGATALLSGAGFAPIRELLRLSLDPELLPSAIAAARPLPEGFRLERFDPTAAHHVEEWVRVNAAAFSDHPEQGAVTAEDFRALTGESWFDAKDLLLAMDEGAAGARETLAGYTWIKTVRGEDAAAGPETELYVLGVDPEYAGRGLGAALLGATLRRMSEHDPARISLYVDGGNANARALYDRAGFVIDQRSTQWLRPGNLAGSGR